MNKMSISVKRPIIWASVFLAAGVLTGMYPGKFGVICLLAIAAGAIVLMKRPMLFLVFVAFFVFGVLKTAHSLKLPLAPGGSHTISGFVEDVSQTSSGGQRIFFRCLESDGAKANFLVMAYLKPGYETEIGDELILRGVLESLSEKRNPGGFDEFLFYTARKIKYKTYPVTVETGPRRKTALLDLRRLQSEINSVYDASLPERESSILKSMITGDRSSLEDPVKDLYRMAGIYHLLCISGLHITVIFVALDSVLGRLFGKRFSGAVTFALIVLYCMMTGAGVASVRAVLTAGVVIFGKLIYRERDLAASASLSFICLIAYEPVYLADIGFQLSFSAVYGIAFLSGPINRLLRLEAASVSLAAILGNIPLVCYHFHVFSPYSIFVNMIILPTSALLITTGLIAGIAGLAVPGAAVFLSGAPYYLLRFYGMVCGLFSRLPLSSVLTGRIAIPAIIAAYASMGFFAYWLSGKELLSGRKNMFLASLPVFIIITAVSGLPPKNPEMTMLDVGQGDCFVIRGDGRVFISDCGGLRGRAVLIPYLDYIGVSSVDAVFLSHTDDDHINGMFELADSKAVGRVFIPDIDYGGNANYLALKDKLSDNGILLTGLVRGDHAESGGFSYTVLNPAGGASGDDNDLSLVTRLDIEGVSVLLTGDVTSEAEREIVSATGVSGVDILKLPHHGSNYSAGPELLDAAKPSAALVSAGARNVYGHPGAETLGRLSARGIRVYNTASQGAVTIHFLNGGYTVSGPPEKIGEGIGSLFDIWRRKISA